MIQAFGAFAKQLLVSGGSKISKFPLKAYRELLTGFERLQEEQLVIVPGMIELAKTHPGSLAVDDAKNLKYGLKHLAKKLKILTNGATRTDYEVLTIVDGARDGAFPIGLCSATKGQIRLLNWLCWIWGFYGIVMMCAPKRF